MARELILVVDDQEETREFIFRGLLAPHGYRVLLAQDVQDGIQKAADAQPDLILLNLERFGLAALQSLRRHHEHTHILLYTTQYTRNPALQTWLPTAKEDIVEPFAPTLVLAAIERALRENRLRQERDHLREQLQFQLREQKTLHAIGQAVTLLSDYQQVLDRLVEAAVYLVAADEGYLFAREAGSAEIHLRAYTKKKGQRAHPANQLVRDSWVQHVLESGDAEILSGPDAAQVPLLADRRDVADPSGGQGAPRPDRPVTALIDVPIQLHGQAVGLIRVLRTAPHGTHAQAPSGGPARHDGAFSHADLFKISILASYGAVAIENARLRQEIEENSERMAIAEIGASFGSTLRLDTVLDMMMQTAARIIDADRGYIVLLDQENGAYGPRATYGLGLENLSGDQVPIGGDIVRRVLEQGEPLLTVTGEAGSPDNTLRQAICVPIPATSGVGGAIYLEHHNHQRYFDESHREILTSLAINAAAAVENARLFHQVEAERRKLEAVIRGSEEPVIVTDTDGIVLLMNAAAHRAFDTHKARATGLLLPQVSDHRTLAHLFDQARISGQVQHGELATGDGQTFRATVAPVAGVGFVTTMQDVTEFKQLAQMKTEFVATVSHDLRSPLSTVLGLLNVLQKAGPLNEAQHDFLSSAEQEVKHLITLTSGLLDLARLETDLDLEMEPCDLRVTLIASLESWQSKAGQEVRTLQVDLPARGVFVYGNATRLRQVIDNLLNNAFKYTTRGDRIDVRLFQDGLEAVLEVQDSGIGIPPQDQPYVFDRFYRVRSKETDHIEGSGLGLAIVKSIVERHNGRVWLRSAPGAGSTFGVALPAIEGPSTASPPADGS